MILKTSIGGGGMKIGSILRKSWVLGAIAGVCIGLCGCGQEKPQPQPKPAAVSFPWMDFCNQYRNMEGGIAACKCSTAMSYEETTIAEDEAKTDARSELARQLGLRVKTMVKRYKSRTIANRKRAIGSTFEEVAKQVANQYLQGSRVLASKTFQTPDGKFMVCVAVGLQPQTVKEMISSIAKQAGLTNPRDEDILYQEFKAYKAQQELEKETSETQ
jgi:hypothetical protein